MRLTGGKEFAMIDFEFEFQYAEEKHPALQKLGGSIPAGRCMVLCGGKIHAAAVHQRTDTAVL